jgi:hypothetical protein
MGNCNFALSDVILLTKYKTHYIINTSSPQNTVTACDNYNSSNNVSVQFIYECA